MRGDTSTVAILHDPDVSGHVGALWLELFRKTRGEDVMPEESGGVSEPKQTVLCVDDEPSIREVLEAELENEAYEAVIVASGPEGLDWLETREAAVVLSDHLMPDMSGTEFLARDRKRWPDSFRIMLTAHGDLETVISAVNIGEIHRFLSKPWDPRGLKLAINEGLERHRLIQENRELVRRLGAQNIELRSLNETLEARVAERTA